MKKFKTKYESFLEHPDLTCTKCGRKMRLWPDQVKIIIFEINWITESLCCCRALCFFVIQLYRLVKVTAPLEKILKEKGREITRNNNILIDREKVQLLRV